MPLALSLSAGPDKPSICDVGLVAGVNLAPCWNLDSSVSGRLYLRRASCPSHRPLIIWSRKLAQSEEGIEGRVITNSPMPHITCSADLPSGSDGSELCPLSISTHHKRFRQSRAAGIQGEADHAMAKGEDQLGGSGIQHVAGGHQRLHQESPAHSK